MKNNIDPFMLAQQAVEAALLSFTSEGIIKKEYLNTKQAARYLGMSKQKLESMRHRGGGPVYTKLSQMVRYKVSDLDAFMAAYARKNTSVGGYHG